VSIATSPHHLDATADRHADAVGHHDHDDHGPRGRDAGRPSDVVRPSALDLSEVPVGVARALVLVVSGFAASALWPAPQSVAHGRDGVGEPALMDADPPDPACEATRAQAVAALEVIEAAQAAVAFCDAVSVRAAGVIAAQYEAHLLPADPGALPAYRRAQLLAQGRDGAALEIQTATGMSPTEARRRVRYARAGAARTATTRALLGAGRCTLPRALTLLEETAGLPPELADHVSVQVLRPPRTPRLPAGTTATRDADAPSGALAEPDEVPDGPRQAVSQATFRRRLALELADAGASASVHAAALRARRAGVALSSDGTASLWVRGEACRTVAAHRRVDQIARAVRHHGDDRTLDQLRSDVILDLLLYGWVDTSPPASSGTATTPTTTTTTTTTTTRRPAPGDHDPASHRRAGSPVPSPVLSPAPSPVPFGVEEAPALPARDVAAYRAIGDPPPALVHVVVSLDTLAGTGDAPGELPGHGFLSAAQTRRACVAAGSTWRRLVTDPATGHLVELTSTGYRPSPALTAQVHARDVTCRGPGCTVPATDCDFDHDVDFADGGRTATGNGSAKHRRHHNVKTRRLWGTDQHPDGTITWTTLLGRSYTTDPYDYRELDDPEPDPGDDGPTERMAELQADALPTREDEPPF
jgi:hypothetical protein